MKMGSKSGFELYTNDDYILVFKNYIMKRQASTRVF